MEDGRTSEDLLLEEPAGDALNTDHIDEKILLEADVDEKPLNGGGEVVKEEIDTEVDDLYDAAIEPSGANDSVLNSSILSSSSASASATTVASEAAAPRVERVRVTAPSSTSSDRPRRFSCYIGNMTWWTTDMDIAKAVTDLGCEDIAEIRFYENRVNGQSRGYCLCAFLSESSMKVVMEQLSNEKIHGQQPVVLPFTKQSLAKFEEAAAKVQTRQPTAGMGSGSSSNGPDAPKKDGGVMDMGTIRIGPSSVGSAGGAAMNRGGVGMNQQMGHMRLGGGSLMGGGVGVGGGPGPVMGGATPLMAMGRGMPMNPMMHNPMMNRGMMGGPPPMAGPPMMGGGMGMGMMPPMQQPMQPMQQQPPRYPPQPQPLMATPMAPPPGQMPPGGPGAFPPAGAHINPSIYPGFQGGEPVSAGEFEELLNRSRTVSTSAISRAVSDAAAGNVDGAVDTILTAITIIKQSKIAGDERCKGLIANLQDTLNAIENKTSSRKSHRRDRSRSRSRDRKRHRRSSRSRSRSDSPRRRRY